ncbi:MAG: O-antigen ligase family protein [Leptotrichia wadei]|jgi:O-antigen polymerase|uniref:O-antigen ligase family protein n=1 Tax=Leptotrichia TaxID=32067 RepID=UPI0015C0C6E0|nr:MULTISPECIES: O-antigen ligase family protein [Leptotrichia]MBS6019374.1 O-antigen ligase family protein [Leptotrichia wadei]NWO26163.1 O-antigen ligase family protein [Leptotrichia sp. oral taxon 417]
MNNEKINLIINKVGFIFCLLTGVSLFLSEKFENNVVIPLLLLTFAVSMFFKKNRKDFFSKIDVKFSVLLVVFVAMSFIIAAFDGGIGSRLDNYNLRYLIFFPLAYFINDNKRIFNFLKSFLFGGTIILILAIINFIKNYNEWAHPVGFEYPRVTAILTVQDFANIMCIILLYLMSFLLFYKNEDNKKNKMIKIYLAIMSILVLFIVIVNRSKMVYISLLPTILYIMYKKRKRYVLAAVLMCFTGYFALPVSISNRIQYIVKYKNDPSSNLRVIFWKTGAEAFKQKPLYGWRAEERKKFNLDYYKKIGVSDYVYKYFLTGNKLRTQHYVASHNSYLQYLLDFGILGFVFFILIIINLLIKLFKINFYKYDRNTKITAFEIGTKVSFIAWIIQGMTDDNLNDKHLVITLTVLIFFIDYLYRNIKNQKTLNFENEK